MGCQCDSCDRVGEVPNVPKVPTLPTAGTVPEEVKEILKEVVDKVPGIIDTFQIEHTKILNERTEILKEREEKVEKAINDKIEKKELEDLLLKYNLKEIENEKDLIINEVDKMHSLHELGEEYSEKLKKVTLDILNKKLDKAPLLAKKLLKSKIDEVNKSSSKDFLDSEFGKPLKTELEKQGMREDVLKEFMEKLEAERKKRRIDEREKYKIEKNEFPPKDELRFTAKDLFKLIFDEYKDEFKSNLKGKLIDNCL